MNHPIFIPEHIQQLKPYEPGLTKEQLREKLGVPRIISLWNNENPWGPAPSAEQAAQRAISKNNLYPDPGAVMLKQALAKHLNVPENTIVAGNGGESLLMLMLTALCKPGDEILTSQGSFVIMYLWAKIRNLPLRLIPLTPSYAFDLDRILDSVSDHTRLIYLANANNPTGTGINSHQLKSFIEKIPPHILIMVDEAYFEFSVAMDPDFPDTTRWEYPNVMTLRSFSKCYGIAGTRLGYLITQPPLAEAIQKVSLTFEPTGLAQEIGTAVLNDAEYLNYVVSSNKAALQQYYDGFNRLHIKYIPSMANFVMIDMETVDRARKLFHGLYSRGILTRMLDGSGLGHCIRISAGRPEDNKEVLDAIQSLQHTL